ncbi:MAG: thiol reductant ABC exporter subunit CydC [Alphaproteobacteria bacterium]
MYFDPRLWQFTKGLRGAIAWSACLGLLAVVAGIARLALLGWLLAQVFAGRPLSELIWPIVAAAVAMGLRGWLEYARTMVAHRTAAAVQLAIRQQLYDHMNALGPAYFASQRTGDVLLSMIDGVEQLETYFGQYLPQLIVAAATPVVIFAVAVFLDGPVALCLLIAALFTLIAPAAFHTWDRKNAQSRQKAYAAFGADFLDTLQGLATLKAFGQSAARGRLLAQRARELFRATMWVLATNALARGITDVGIAVGAGAALVIGAWRVEAGEMSLAVLLIVLMLGVEVFRPLRDLRALLHQGMVGQSAAGAVFRILDATPPLGDGDDRLPAEAVLAPTIDFDDVVFAYPGAPRRAHDGLDFHIAAGERVGIVGASGAGKSTIAKLLLRFHDPDAGAIRLGGHDLRSLSFSRLRAQVAVVQQDAFLFYGTVADNLRLGKADASLDELRQAARDANADEFIMRLPQGYDTVIGERGLRLSGGQRQRLAIARALLRDAPILLLDEALSSVDAENEATIQQALNRLMTGRTTLIFAHRLSSVIDCDRILVLDQGKVAESGGHDELLRAGGAYHLLMSAQAAEARDGAPLAEVMPLETDRDDGPAGTATPQASEIVAAEGMGWGQAIATLTRLILPWKGKMGATLALGVARVLAFIGVGAVSALIVAAVRAGEPFGGLVIALAVLAPLAGLLHWLESWLAHDMAFRLLAEMRIALYEKLDKLAPAYLLRRRSGDLVAMATQDVEKVEYFFAHTVAPAVVAVLVPGAVLALLLWFGWPLALALLPFLAAVAVSPFLARGRVDRLGSRAAEALGDLNATITDTIQGLLEIAAFQQAGTRRRAFVDAVKRHHALRMPFFRDLTAQSAILEVATGLGGLAVVVTGASLAAAGEIDRGLLPLFTLMAMAAFLPISEIAQIGRQLAETLASTRRLTAVDREVPAVSDGPRDALANDGGLSVSFDQVDFRYPDAVRPALRDVGFVAPAGSTLAIVGPSGAGKTTAAHLLMRFWDPDAGRIEVGGVDVWDLNLDTLRQHVALVAQDTYLFNASLGDNIRLARPDASDDEVMAALRQAALGDLVASLPAGLDTPVGERGTQLSGGQRQRVAIARAFLKDAPILILDEATSHLDAASEALVRQALDTLMASRTTIVIAHRLSTVRAADRIVVLDAGRVVESGRHEELLAKGGLYAHLLQRQLGGPAPRQAAG